RSPVTALLGARQTGKTTLALQYLKSNPGQYLDLESYSDQLRLSNPEMYLSSLEGLVVIDEVQRRPDLFAVIRSIVDRHPGKVTFLLLGSASPDIIKGVSESLAGRLAFVDISGLSIEEVGTDEINVLWSRGGFPPAYTASDDSGSFAWREDFIRTFLERDLPQLGYPLPASTMRRFWMMLASCHGQVLNLSAIGRAMGISHTTVTRYIDILEGAYVIRRLQPWYANIRKRQVKSSKLYLRDSGILHALLGIRDYDDLVGNQVAGHSWEGFVAGEIIQAFNTDRLFFWRTQQNAELDILLFWNGKRFGFEIKFSENPRPGRSARIAIEDLKLEHLWCIYPGEEVIPVDANITLWPLRNLYSHPLLPELS
ncbi:MAG: ATP-binding protein, partial [Actinomycetia bacterium]|nr:ATP-binding protein [Actinomycetes bacterium]